MLLSASFLAECRASVFRFIIQFVRLYEASCRLCRLRFLLLRMGFWCNGHFFFVWFCFCYVVFLVPAFLNYPFFYTINQYVTLGNIGGICVFVNSGRGRGRATAYKIRRCGSKTIEINKKSLKWDLNRFRRKRLNLVNSFRHKSSSNMQFFSVVDTLKSRYFFIEVNPTPKPY